MMGNTNPNLKEIYAQQAAQYQRLVEREDYQGNLLPAIQRIRSLAGLDVVEPGAGTGRISCLMAPYVRSLRLLDASQAMLDVAIARLQAGGWAHWQAQVASHMTLPVEENSADLVIVGWSLCYAALDHPEDWRSAVRQALSEMERILRPGGTLLVIETLGTGFEQPHPPEILRPYLAFLDEYGFQSTWIRTDYQFESLDEADELVRFFFGPELAEKARRENWRILPECTGIWWKQISLEEAGVPL